MATSRTHGHIFTRRRPREEARLTRRSVSRTCSTCPRAKSSEPWKAISPSRTTSSLRRLWSFVTNSSRLAESINSLEGSKSKSSPLDIELPCEAAIETSVRTRVRIAETERSSPVPARGMAELVFGLNFPESCARAVGFSRDVREFSVSLPPAYSP